MALWADGCSAIMKILTFSDHTVNSQRMTEKGSDQNGFKVSLSPLSDRFYAASADLRRDRDHAKQ